MKKATKRGHLASDAQESVRHRSLNSVAFAAVALSLPLRALAAPIDTGNQDLQLRWDNSIRYNVGIRTDKPDSRIVNEPTNAPLALGDSQFSRGDVVVDRLDLLSEMDLVYKKNYGLRVSAAGWYDPTTYNDSLKTPTPALAAFCQAVYTDCKYSNYTKRFVSGPSAEVLDAFVFSSFELGDVETSAKLGRHTIYWGSGLYSSAIAYGQEAVDGMKAQMSPGIEYKELFLPEYQATFTSQLSPEISIGGQRSFEWRHDRMPESGTFFDASSSGYYGPNGPLIRQDPIGQPSKHGGDWGVMAKWVPQSDLPSVGLYYREFYEKTPYNSYLTSTADPLVPQFAIGYNPVKNKLIGLGMEANIASVNLGLELVHRSDATLRASTYGHGVGLLDPNDLANQNTSGARGDVWDMVLNAVTLLPQTPLFPGGNFSAELTYQRLDKVTYNPTLATATGLIPNAGYIALGSPRCLNPTSTGPGGLSDSCASRDAWNLAFNLQPQWPQAMPGIDLSASLYVSAGIHGNSPTGAISEGSTSYSLGLQADIYTVHSIKIAYNDQHSRIVYTPGSAASSLPTLSGSGSWPYNDRGWLSITYKTSF